jgi:hypothetical protein
VGKQLARRAVAGARKKIVDYNNSPSACGADNFCLGKSITLHEEAQGVDANRKVAVDKKRANLARTF